MSLRFAADRRTIMVLVAYAAAIGAGFLMRGAVGWGASVGWMLVLCALAFSVAVITHNTIHVPMWRSARMNAATQVVLSVLYGNSVSVFVRGHNFSHHRHLQTSRDLMRTSKARFRWNLLNQVFFLAIVGLAIDRGNRQFKKEERRLRSPWYRQHVAERLAVYAVTLTLLAVDWQSALLFVLIPRFFGLWAIAGINYAQHDGCDADDPYNHSRNFVGHAINWALFNNGFHTAHHDSPGVHWSELRDLHEQTVAPKIHPALCQPSLLAYAWKAYVWPGRRLNFDGTPVVLPPPQADDSWIPASHALPAEVSIGAANALRNSTDR